MKMVLDLRTCLCLVFMFDSVASARSNGTFFHLQEENVFKFLPLSKVYHGISALYCLGNCVRMDPNCSIVFYDDSNNTCQTNTLNNIIENRSPMERIPNSENKPVFVVSI